VFNNKKEECFVNAVRMHKCLDAEGKEWTYQWLWKFAGDCQSLRYKNYIHTQHSGL
jgi:hypothetical protein